MKKKGHIPQIILPVSIDVVKFLQKSFPCQECLKECKSVWVTQAQLDTLRDNMGDELSIECCYVLILSRGFNIDHICFTAGKINTLKDCSNCIHFHDAIVK